MSIKTARAARYQRILAGAYVGNVGGSPSQPVKAKHYMVYVRGPGVPAQSMVLRLPVDRERQMAALDRMFPPSTFFRSFEGIARHGQA